MILKLLSLTFMGLILVWFYIYSSRPSKLSVSPHGNFLGNSPPVGSLPKSFPPFQHPSHQLLEENGFKQQKWDSHLLMLYIAQIWGWLVTWSLFIVLILGTLNFTKSAWAIERSWESVAVRWIAFLNIPIPSSLLHLGQKNYACAWSCHKLHLSLGLLLIFYIFHV